MSWTSNGPSYGPGGGDDLESLVAQIKELQRHDAAAKEQWIAYTDIGGQGKRDPAKHSVDFLLSFLTQLKSGARLPTQDDTVPFAEVAKLMQKKSVPFKTVWANYCQQHGGGKNDPSRHDNAYHAKFLDHLAQVVCMTPQMNMSSMNPMMMNAGEPPLKRMRDSSGMGMPTMGMGGCGGGDKQACVERIKAFQRMGVPQKELWWSYADTYLSGIRDPNRHDGPTLQEFCVNHNVPDSSPMGGPSPFSGGMMGGGMMMNGPSAMRGGGNGPASGPPMDPEKEQLVTRVKSFQRMGSSQKELWWSYADAYLGGVRDPARHEAGTLHEFCMNHAVPEASSMANTPMGGGMCGMSSPGGGMGGPAGPMDPEKEALVGRIKSFQKISRENAEIWGTFCGRIRDPSKQDVDKLREFCATYGC